MKNQIIINNEIINQTNLSIYEKYLMILLLFLLDNNGQIVISYSELQEMANFSVAQIRRCIKELSSKGFITKSNRRNWRNNGFESNIYQITDKLKSIIGE